MRVVHVIASMAPEHGGTSAVVANLSAAQAGLGLDAHVVCGNDFRREDLSAAEFLAIPTFCKVVIHPVEVSLGVNFLLCAKALGVVASLLIPGTVLHLHGVWEPLLLHISRMARRCGVPYVLAPHSMLHPWQMRRYAFAKQILFSAGWRSMLTRSTFIHVLNVAEQGFVRQIVPAAKTVVIPNGVDPNRFFPGHCDDTDSGGGDVLRGRPYVLFLSRLHYQKGVRYLVDAFIDAARDLPDFLLVIAGPDGGELGGVKRRMQCAGLSDRLVVPGPVYGRTKLRLLQGASCFCLPSLNEGSSVAVLEAMSCGVPVIASEKCYFPEIGTNKAGIVVPLDVNRIRQAILLLSRDVSLRAQMGRKGREMVERSFNWSRIAADTHSCYEKIARAQSEA